VPVKIQPSVAKVLEDIVLITWKLFASVVEQNGTIDAMTPWVTQRVII